MAEFKVERIQLGKVQSLRTQGYLDDYGGQILKEICTKAIDEGNNRFIFNFSGTPVINSYGLSILLDLMVRIIDYNDGKVGVTGLSRMTRKALEMTGVLTLAAEFASEAEAQMALDV
ncbi:MAG: STAS domain-containing protein [Candidatus Riflebacteria bacterium]|nr:STAS domain-containing protein [Candidatus Riflebacteria bacterium]